MSAEHLVRVRVRVVETSPLLDRQPTYAERIREMWRRHKDFLAKEEGRRKENRDRIEAEKGITMDSLIHSRLPRSR